MNVDFADEEMIAYRESLIENWRFAHGDQINSH